ncbi:thioredoxin family protein [Azoarcus taiwanensis]|uniref:Tetratricopeptide repeat protein n=1 Tax=Azoarcus taiwanensis TaxID=666964 RepID=A0A972FAL1_9RHOO|nr:co-chaperone YbbN [Azoarcus taiwanensis]NMG01682.1 tetratricopeptide repeat protein [Azoarcus taiwanensis]
MHFAHDVNADNFQQIVIEGSQTVPVVIDFWAPWCGPCKVLKPILEKLAEECGGKFILAKINSDENPDLAAQFGVRGIPNVKAVYHGAVVDEFTGALPEGAVREFIDRILPSPADELRAQAATLRASGDLECALRTLGEASQLDDRNEQIRLDAAEILVELERFEDAKPLLDSLSPVTLMDDRPRALLAKVNFALAGHGGADEASLRERIAAQPEDMESRLQLAELLVAAGRHAEGMDELLEMIRRDRAWNDDAARKTLLSVFSVLGSHPLVGEYRRKLTAALY